MASPAAQARAAQLRADIEREGSQDVWGGPEGDELPDPEAIGVVLGLRDKDDPSKPGPLADPPSASGSSGSESGSASDTPEAMSTITMDGLPSVEDLKRVGATQQQAESLLEWLRAAPPGMREVEIGKRVRSVRDNIEAEITAERRKAALGLGAVAVGVVVLLVILARRRARAEAES